MINDNKSQKGFSSFFIAQWKKIKNVFHQVTAKEMLVYCIAIVAMIAALWPMLAQGVILNDELQNRFDRKIGFWTLVVENTKVHFDKGRVLSLIVDWRYLGFLSENMFFNRCICAMLIVLNAALLARVLYRVCKDKHFSLLTGFLFVVLMPLTFQHAAPAAFTPLVAVPMLFLSISLLYYMTFLEQELHQKKNAIISAIFFFLAICGYEFVIVYALLFPLLYIYYGIREKRSFRFFDIVKSCVWHIAAGVLFLVLYFGLALLFPTGYTGNQIGFVSLSSSFEIIKTLFLSAIPGYYCFNGVSKYQMQTYNGGLLNAQSLLSLGVFFIVIGAAICIFYFASQQTKAKNSWWSAVTLALCLIYMVLPSLPNAVSLMYQGTVNSGSFTSLPVSYFLYGAAIIFIAQLLWLLKNLFHKTKVIGAIAVCLCVMCVLIPQQALNHVVGRVQAEDYQRLQMIEGIFETKTMKACHNKTVYSKNIYQTRNLLAIHDGYWERYAALYDINVDFVDEMTEPSKPLMALNVQDKSVVLWSASDGLCYVFAEKLLDETYCLVDGEGFAYCLPRVSPGNDADYYLYTFQWNVIDRTIMPIS